MRGFQRGVGCTPVWTCFAGGSDQQRQFNYRCSDDLTHGGTEKRMASRSRSSFPTLGPVDYGPFYPRNHRAWTLARLLWSPSQGCFCPNGTISRLPSTLLSVCAQNERASSPPLPSRLAPTSRSWRNEPPRYRLGEVSRAQAARLHSFVWAVEKRTDTSEFSAEEFQQNRFFDL